MPKPKAIVCISAHWLTNGTHVTAMQNPRTIHDFGRLDDRLFEIQYKAQGEPKLAQELIKKVQQTHIEEDHHWGFDHGTWTVLRWMYPKADIPMIQLSLDYRKNMQYHYDLAKDLAFLRQKGVLIVGSGNIVHNLRTSKFPESSTYDWAIQFDETSKNLIENKNHQALIHSPDHYLPLLYTLALQTERDTVGFPIEGISYGSISMRSVMIGA